MNSENGEEVSSYDESSSIAGGAFGLREITSSMSKSGRSFTFLGTSIHSFKRRSACCWDGLSEAGSFGPPAPAWVPSTLIGGKLWELLGFLQRLVLAFVWDLCVWCPFISPIHRHPPLFLWAWFHEPALIQGSFGLSPHPSQPETLCTAGSKLIWTLSALIFPAVLRWLCGKRCPALKLGIPLNTLRPEVYNGDSSIPSTFHYPKEPFVTCSLL